MLPPNAGPARPAAVAVTASAEGLAYTGTNVGWLLSIALLLLLAGAAMFMVGRRRPQGGRVQL